MATTLELVLVLLAAGVAMVVLCRILNLPPLLGYLAVGIAIGPNALGWIPDTGEARKLAEFGVVFLMFSIGLEFSLPKLFQMRRTVFGFGLAQVVLTLAAGLGASVALGFGWRAGVVLGGALAMSSTAIVIRMLSERMQIETPHGREIVGVLLFQDLAVVPFLIVIPALAPGEEDLAARLAIALFKAGAVLVVLLFVGQKLMRGWFHIVAARRSRELFILNVLLITLGLAWLTDVAGLSLALGAFLAGMLIAETEYRQQVADDIRPFREVLLGLFFVTMGMMLDPRVVWGSLALVMFLLVVPVLFKFALVAVLARAFRASPGTALRAGLALSQAGEFGLVIVALASALALLERELTQIVTASMLLSMFASPFLLHWSDRLVLRWSSSEWMLRSLELHRIAAQSLATERHVIVCGYGRTGQRLAHLFEREGLRFVALDLDPDRVRDAAAAGEPVVYGDAARREALVAAGITRAAAMVVSFADLPVALKVLHHARGLNPAMPVVVRTRDDAEHDRLIAAGATEVVPETFESSLMLASHVMVLIGVPLRRVVARIRDVQEHRYSLLRGFFHGPSDVREDEAREPRLHSVALSAGSHAIGKSIAELALAADDVSVSAVRRRESRIMQPSVDTVLQEGDVMVLLGSPEQLEAVEMRLLRGGK